MPKCSIIMPAHNAADTLQRAITSVQSQDLTNWELIIVNDGSSDATQAVAQSFQNDDDRIHILSLSDKSGAAKARNTALKHAKGRYIAFLDADDAWMPHKLDTQISFMRERGSALSFTQFIRHQNNTSYTVRVPEAVTYKQLLRGNVIGCLTAMYDTELIPKTPMPEIKLRHDYALWLSLLQKTPIAHGIQTTCATHYRQKSSLSSGAVNGARGTWHMLRNTQSLSRIAVFKYMSQHYVNRLRSHQRSHPID